MTDAPTLAVAATALAVALAAAWYHLPRAPQLDAERWFKVMLATLLRGCAEAAGSDAAAWEAAVVRFVPYHPLGRFPERKVAGVVPEGAALPGEKALTAALAELPPGRPRWERLYDRDEQALEARLGDPFDLGPAYDPAHRLAPDATWDGLAAWSKEGHAFRDALARRFPAKWVLVRGASPVDVVGALAAELGEMATVVPPGSGADGIGAALKAALSEPSDRLVAVAEGEAAGALLRALLAAPAVRDRVLIVLAVGGHLADPDWMGRNFSHHVLDTEMHRVTTYASVQWLDRDVETPGIPGLPLEDQRFPEPAGEPGVSWIEAVDLGPLPAAQALPAREIARGIWAWAACWALSRS